MSNAYGQKIAHYQRPVELLDIARRGSAQSAGQTATGDNFKDMFSKEISGRREISFSRHAQERLFSRGIALSDEDLHKISTAIDKADVKGAKETLVMMDDVAFVISVKNRTVITAFDRENLREGIVTSIDSAVIL